MEEQRNNRVSREAASRTALKNDRARIQVGRISPFGLMEMSRQRIRTGVLESSSIPCVHCGGSGYVRATASVALHILRSIEEALLKSATHNLVLRTRTESALYILNQKRGHLRELEVRFGVTLTIAADERLAATTAFQLDRGEPAQRAEGPVTGVRAQAISQASEFDDAEELDEAETIEETVAEAAEEGRSEDAREDGDGEGGRRRRRRRRRRGGRSDETREAGEGEDESGSDELEGEPTAVDAAEVDAASPEAIATAAGPDSGSTDAGPDTEAGAEDESGRRRRRGRRGGRGRSEGRGSRETESTAGEQADEIVAALSPEEPVSAEVLAEMDSAAPVLDAAEPAGGRAIELPVETRAAPESKSLPEPKTMPEFEILPEPAREPAPAAEPVAVVLSEPVDPDRPKRAGWWSRTKAALTGE